MRRFAEASPLPSPTSDTRHPESIPCRTFHRESKKGLSSLGVPRGNCHCSEERHRRAPSGARMTLQYSEGSSGESKVISESQWHSVSCMFSVWQEPSCYFSTLSVRRDFPNIDFVWRQSVEFVGMWIATDQMASRT